MKKLFMDNKNTRTISDEEYDRAERAAAEIMKLGKSDLKCFKCGTNYIIEFYETAYRIHCETDNCFSVSIRGV